MRLSAFSTRASGMSVLTMKGIAEPVACRLTYYRAGEELERTTMMAGYPWSENVREITMRFRTIALASVVAFSSTFALAQSGGGSSGGSSGGASGSSGSVSGTANNTGTKSGETLNERTPRNNLGTTGRSNTNLNPPDNIGQKPAGSGTGTTTGR
jgi:hypothetical protein